MNEPKPEFPTPLAFVLDAIVFLWIALASCATVEKKRLMMNCEPLPINPSTLKLASETGELIQSGFYCEEKE